MMKQRDPLVFTSGGGNLLKGHSDVKSGEDMTNQRDSKQHRKSS